MKVCLYLCLVTLTWFQFADSAGLTCATKPQLKDITNLIAKWDSDSVIKNDKIKTLYTYKGRETKQEYRLDEERPTGDFNLYRIQSGSYTYADVLVKQKVDFGKRKIRNAFVVSATECQNEKLDVQLRLYSTYVADSDDDESVGDVDAVFETLEG